MRGGRRNAVLVGLAAAGASVVVDRRLELGLAAGALMAAGTVVYLLAA